MRRQRTDTGFSAERPRVQSRWMPNSALPEVGLDPAVWSQRVRQVALWRLLETWNAGRRLH